MRGRHHEAEPNGTAQDHKRGTFSLVEVILTAFFLSEDVMVI
jgi:hypothetical protein